MRSRALTITLMVVAVSMCAAGVFAAPFRISKEARVYRFAEDDLYKNDGIWLLSKGTIVEKLEDKGTWIKIKFRSAGCKSITGYMKAGQAVVAPDKKRKHAVHECHVSKAEKGISVSPVVKSEEVSKRLSDTKEVVPDSSKVNEVKAQEVEAERNRLFQESWGLKKEIKGLKQQLAAQEDALKSAPLAANKEVQKLTKELESAHAELDQLRGSPGIEMFTALDAKGENVKLRGFGSIRLIPINNDYLVLLPASQAKKAEALFPKTNPVELVGKVNAFFFTDKRYFVSRQVAPAKPVVEENKH